MANKTRLLVFSPLPLLLNGDLFSRIERRQSTETSDVELRVVVGSRARILRVYQELSPASSTLSVYGETSAIFHVRVRTESHLALVPTLLRFVVLEPVCTRPRLVGILAFELLVDEPVFCVAIATLVHLLC